MGGLAITWQVQSCLFFATIELLRMHIIYAAPADIAANTCAAQQAVTGQSGPEMQLPVFEMHSGFWVNLHHFLYLQARLSMSTSPSDSSPLRGAAQPDEIPVSLIGFPEADIHAWQDRRHILHQELLAGATFC